MKCVECGCKENIHKHHILPKSKGGKATVPLCEKCHSKVHGKEMSINYLTRLSLFERDKEVLCDIFYLITVECMSIKEIVKHMSKAYDIDYDTRNINRKIERIKYINVADIMATFGDMLGVKNNVYYNELFFINRWNKFTNKGNE